MTAPEATILRVYKSKIFSGNALLSKDEFDDVSIILSTKLFIGAVDTTGSKVTFCLSGMVEK